MPFKEGVLQRIVALGVLKRWMYNYKQRKMSTQSVTGRLSPSRWSSVRKTHHASVELSLSRLRVKAYRLSEQEFRALSVDADFWDQGDEDFHSAYMFEKRMMLRKHPLVVKQLTRWQKLIPQPVIYDDYVHLMMCIYKALVRPPRALQAQGSFDEADARACAEEDWQGDVGWDATLSTRHYMDAIFQLADHWTHTIDSEEYAIWLRCALSRISTADGRLKSIDEINFVDIGLLVAAQRPNDGRSSNARYEAELERLRKHITGPPKIPVQLTKGQLAKLAKLPAGNTLCQLPPGRDNFGVPNVTSMTSTYGMSSARDSTSGWGSARDGKQDPRVPPGGSIRADGVILDANGNPVLGADGKPLIASAGGSRGLAGDGSSTDLDAFGLPLGSDYGPGWGGVAALADALAASQGQQGVGTALPRVQRAGFRGPSLRPDFRERAIVQRGMVKAWVDEQQTRGRGPRHVPILPVNVGW